MNELETTIDKIKSIIYDYTLGSGPKELWDSDIDEISKRIATEVVGVNDDNEFVNLKDLIK
jgi:hypothetical protein